MHHQTRVSIELLLKFLLCFASSPVTVRATTSILEQGLPVYVFTSDELVHWVMLLFARMLACSGTRKRDSKTTTHIRWTSLFIPYKFQIRLAGHGNLFPRCDGGARSSQCAESAHTQLRSSCRLLIWTTPWLSLYRSNSLGS